MDNGFLFHIDYNKETSQICKYYVNSKNKTEQIKETFFKPVHILQKDYDELFSNQDTSSLFLIGKKHSSINNEEVIQITPLNIEAKEQIEDYIKLYSLQTFEFDISEVDYYLIQTPEKISKTHKAKEYRIISLDIETIGTENNQVVTLISLASYSKEFNNRVLINSQALNESMKHLKDKDHSKEFSEEFELHWFNDEKDLLLNLQKMIQEFQPQFIVGWNVINFDFRILKILFEKHNLEFNFSSLDGEHKMRVTSEFFGKDQLYFAGVLVLDCIQLLKTNYIQYSDYKLSSVAREVLGEDKVDLEADDDSDYSISEKIKTIEHNWNTNPLHLIWYNYKDATLVLDILEEVRLLDLMFERSYITQTLLERLQSPIAVLDQMYLKELHREDKIATTHYPTQGTTPIEGAYVIEPESGFYNNIVVFDFASLYPSLMITFNIDPFTYSQKGEIVAPNDAKFRKEKGILPKILKELFELRKEAKKEKNSVKSHALKITMNSFYGAMASAKSRYYNKHLAEAITAFGRECLLQAKKYLEEELSYKVIYGDTDSVFAQITFKTTNRKEEIKNIEKEINKHFSSWVEKTYGVESFLTIEGEKIFDKFFIASKKRYVGLDSNYELHFTGMESVRGDWTQLAKDFQTQLIKEIFNDKSNDEIKTFILNEIKKLKEKKYDDKLIYTKKITKPLDQYTKTTPPHVKAAREIDKFSGKIVKYVMTTRGPKHISLFDPKTMEYDYEHYIEKQLQGVSDEILEAIGLNFEIIVYEKKQNNLNKFF